MNEITGNKEFVLQLLKDTARNFAVRHPEAQAAKGMKGVKAVVTKAVTPDNEEQQTERDQIVERLQRAYENAQLGPVAPAQASAKKGAKKAKGAKALPAPAPTAAVVQDVWYAPRDRMIALLQSAMDEYIERKKTQPAGMAKGLHKKKITKTDAKDIFYKEPPAPAGKKKAAGKKAAPEGAAAAKGWVGEKYDTLDPGWLEVAYEAAKIHLKGKHPFIRHKNLTDFRYRMADKQGPTRVALLADWGGGNEHAEAVRDLVQALDPAPDYVIHLGDVYYAGTGQEVNERFFGYWPGSLEPGRSFALNSNHEMYSGGYSYFDITLPKLGQEASYFCLENDDWRLIGLDTGYIEHDLNVEQMEWLTALVNESDKKNILLSHHQPFSAFDLGTGGEERLQNWTKDLAKAGKIDLWIFGHEHLCVAYKPFRGITGRCIGHGCFPYDKQTGKPIFAGPSYPQIEWVLTAADPKRPARGAHGFALLEFDGDEVKVSYFDEAGKNKNSPPDEKF
jgi:predicted phosphodiesterase